jgi:AcrR family transcriptional regulator
MENESNGTTRRERERFRLAAEILDAAAELFASYGYEGTSVKQIAEKAELSVGKIYNHFESKEEIFRALLDKYMTVIHTLGDDACREDDPPLVQLQCRIEVAIEYLKSNTNFILIYLNENPLRLEGMIKEEIKQNWEILAGLIESAAKRGDIPREDPEMLAAALLGAMHRILYMLADSGRVEAFDTVPAFIHRVIIEPLETRQKSTSKTEGS